MQKVLSSTFLRREKTREAVALKSSLKAVTHQQPDLKWFAHDDNIKRLVEMCCNGKRLVKAETLELAGSSSATMSQKTACTIDGAMGKMGCGKGSSSMDAQAAKEHHTKLHFHIEF